MRVLLTGATGFIGRHIAARLLTDGHAVTAVVRDPAVMRRRFPNAQAIGADIARLTRPEDWQPLLSGIDAVVNCAGILQATRATSAEAIHTEAPIALFDAAQQAGIRRVVQISAVSADREVGTDYARTKAAADDHLRASALDWFVIRPSLVHGQGSYGGTSFLRGLAGLPMVIPLIGDGAQVFQPIHADDVARAVTVCLDPATPPRQTLDAVGPETLTTRQMIARTRAWLDLPEARFIAIPMPLIRVAARIGDRIGGGPVTTTALRQMEYGNVSDPKRFAEAIGFTPRSLDQSLIQSPSHVQDRWQARLYFLPGLLTLALALMWFGSAIAGWAALPPDAIALTRMLGLPDTAASWLAGGFCLLDLGIGAWIVSRRQPVWCGLAQLAVVSGYTLGLGLALPHVWLDPYGALLKNLPILTAILVWMATRERR